MELRFLLKFLARQSLKIATLVVVAALASLSLYPPGKRLYPVAFTVLVTLLWAVLSVIWAARNKWLQPKGPPYNILHIVASPRLDGAERVVQLLCRHTDPALYRTVIACPGDPLQGIYHEEGFTVERLGACRPTLGSILGLREILTVRNIHLIHAHDHRASLLALLCAGFWDRTPVISHLHSANPWLSRLHPFGLIELLLRNRFSLTLACSQGVKNHFLQHNPLAKEKKIVTVVNGVEVVKQGSQAPDKEKVAELRKSLGIPLGHFVYGMVGRLENAKGIDVLLQAFFQVKTRVDGIALLIVGTGNKAGPLQRMVEDLALEDDVIFTGYREDVAQLMELIDVFTLASRWEGLPMVIMEAMSHGVPVIATNVGGVGEVVRQGKTGLLVEKEDVKGLAVGMERLFRDRHLRESLGAEGRSLVESEFNAVNQAHKIQEVYSGLLKGEPS